MPHNGRERADGTPPAAHRADTVDAVRRYFESHNHVRRGICFVNAGRLEDAAREFSAAAEIEPESRSLAACVAAALNGCGRPDEAAETLGRRVGCDPHDVPFRVRHALSLWKAGRAESAIASLRDGIQQCPGVAELHYQLANLLAAADSLDEAKRAYDRAVILDPDHVDALVGQALCDGVDCRPCDALRRLVRAQRLRPADARINLLLSLAAQAARQQGKPVAVNATMPPSGVTGEIAIDELSRAIEAEPDFVDAFLSLPPDHMEKELFGLLAETLQLALRRQPEYADLHYHCGRVLERLGRRGEAIEVTERAVRIAPGYGKALVQLAKLYRQTNRLADAATRLEQALALGAEYPDVYLTLGHLYRDAGEADRARWAYGKALGINDRLAAAREALAGLEVAEPALTG